tara:strand:- start:337 stop:660 length:324 start_codon:yes stop_codon:yes gene_type:complete
MMDVELDYRRSILLERLMDLSQTGYSDKLRERWGELRSVDIISESSINKMINKNDAIISQYIDENFDLWPTNGSWYKDDNIYSEELDLINYFIFLRINQLDTYFSYP